MIFLTRPLVATAVLIAAAFSLPAQAATSISSSAYGLSVNLAVTPAITVTIGPLASTGGTAAPAYSNSAQLLSVSQSFLLGSIGLTSFAQSFQTGVLTSVASSQFPAIATGTASSRVNNLALSLAATTLGVPTSLLNIGADVSVHQARWGHHQSRASP